MASEQAIANEVISKTVAEANRAAIQAMAARPQSVAEPKIGRPALKQPTFNWEADDKYSELKTFRLEVNSILTMYKSHQTEQLAMVENWLGRIHRVTNKCRKDTCSTLEGLFKILTNKFRHQFNKMTKLLHFHKLSRQDGENAEEWMSRLQQIGVQKQESQSCK